ncbi:MAG: 50S ribosomal protein L21 [Leptospiraceae bacterium]|nr:50S ribosomal protein L21 [Leptospiraceae bacterium]MDW8306772.1 50S ribosomal protein L21 [Leptospiraceae bacterium]
MLAIIELGGRQYKVRKDDKFYTELTGKAVGEEFEIPKVLLVRTEKEVQVGTPYLPVKVRAKVLAEVKGPKIRGFRYRAKTNYHRRWGHRQRYHYLQITSIAV